VEQAVDELLGGEGEEREVEEGEVVEVEEGVEEEVEGVEEEVEQVEGKVEVGVEEEGKEEE